MNGDIPIAPAPCARRTDEKGGGPRCRIAGRRDIPTPLTTEFQPLADDLYWRRIERSRSLSPEARMKAGPELFDYACSISLAGLRQQRPTAPEAELLAELRRRITVKRALEETATWWPPSPSSGASSPR